MVQRGIYTRDGELFGYTDGNRIFDLNGTLTGIIQGQTVYDLDNERRWLLNRDALLDLRGNVIGYLGEAASFDAW